MDHYDYDAVIIGAGIGGLVCGCYLAKAGLRTLIVEKNASAGGYCTSFTRNGYRFDACVHFLSTLREKGKFHTILGNLGVLDKIKIVKQDPSDIIITPDYKIKLFKNIDQTIAEFQKYFPDEKDGIAKFCNYIVSTPAMALEQLRSKTLKELLDSYFSDNSLKTIFSILILALAGFPAHKISALVACLILKEFILFDGGYYPVGGMQAFADTLVQTFVDAGGKIILGKKVNKILVKNNKAIAVMIDNNVSFTTKHTVSACDARQTFYELIGKDVLGLENVQKIDKLVPSYSTFSVYLGIDDNFKLSPELKASIWIMDGRNGDEIYSKMLKCECMFLGLASPSIKDASSKTKKQSLCLTSIVPFKNSSYWINNENRKLVEDRLIGMAEKVLPGISKHISLKFNSTPVTLNKWTCNYAGAAYGWAGTPEQFGNPDISEVTPVENLYLTGHWNNMGSGITSVANSGYNTANSILKKDE